MTTTIEETEARTVAERFAPAVTCLLILVALVDSQIVASIAPQIATGLGASESVVTLGVTIYSIFAATVALGLAWSPAIPAPRRWLPISAATFAFASLVTAVAPHVGVFLAGRALTGVAGGLISALAIAAIANASTYDRRGRQMSLVAVSYFLAPVLGVPIGTILAGRFGWRAVFVLSAVGVAAAGTLVRAFPLVDRRDPAASHTRERPPGFAGAFWLLWRLFNHSRSTRMGVISAFFVSGGLVGFTSFLGIWLANAFAAGSRTIAFVYGVAGVGAVLGGALGGRLADRLGKRRVAVACSAGLALLLPIVPGFAYGAGLLVLVAVTAFVAALRVAPLQALITELVAPVDRPTYVALRNAASQLGIAATVAVCAYAFNRSGMMGVGLVAAMATVIALLTSRRIVDPAEPARPRRGRVLRLARAVVVAVVLLTIALPWALSFLVTKAGTRPDERDRPETPATYGVPFEDVAFPSVDGNMLAGWYLPASDGRITIVMTHGLFRSRFELLRRACDFRQLGYSVLLYDLRRHGQSPAEFATIGYMERHDVEAALAYARTRAPGDRMVLYGISMGAAATLLAASESPGVAAVIADSSFLSLSHTITHHLTLAHIPTIPFAPMLVWMTALRMGFLPGSFDVLAATRRVTCPILFIGGTNDVRMPIGTVLDPLYEAAPNPLKRRFVVEGAGHGHAYDTDPEGYREAVKSFLQGALADGASS